MDFAPPATPVRPTPGAFINTPAPGRQGLFRSASVQQQHQAQQQTQALQPAQAPAPSQIERAARTIGDMLSRDARYPDVETYVGQGISGEYDISTSQAWTPFQKLKTYEIPERIFEQVNQTQMATTMGLFAEINHAWVTIDNQLYLWDYTHPNPELIGYEDQPNTIVTVKLVKPRPKVFVDTISYLLVVATSAEIRLIAVECQKGPEGVHGVTLYQTGLTVSVRGIHVGCIAGSTKTGRIFFADGRDSEDVYELNYQNEEKWFQSKCGKTNHVRKSIAFPTISWSAPKHEYVQQMAIDDTRSLLYTLSSGSSIRVFHMKTDTTLELVIVRPISTIRTLCGHLVRGSELLFNGPLQIVGIDPITAPEANQLSLMATTSTGCRIFLSTTSGGYFNDANSPPNSMQVRHIRFPPPDSQPPNQAPSNSLQPYAGSSPAGMNSHSLIKTTEGFRYAPGSFFCFVQKTNAGNHALFMSAPHAGEITQRDISQSAKYKECAQFLQLGGLMQDIGLVTDPFSAAGTPQGFGNELAVQFDKPLSEFAIMTHNGIETIRRRRLVDIFAAIIKYGGGPQGIEGDLRQIVKQYGMAECAATSLAVACGQGSDIGADSRISKVSDPEVLEYARKAFIEFGGKAQLNENSTVEGLSVDNVRASPRHDGIAMYISRLVRSIWKTPIIKSVTLPTGMVFQPTHPISKLQDIQRALIQLQEFLDSNKQLIDGLAGPEALGRVTSRQDEVELQGENRALTSLMLIINNIIEGISFVLVLFDERLEDILVLLPEEQRVRVRQLTFEGLFSVKEGKDLAKELVKAIVNRNIQKGSNVETVAEALRRKCGSFCSSDDVVIFKAQENLKKAADVGANAERGRLLLNDSLRLFEQVGKSLSMENLNAAVDQYIALEFYAGAIRLALKVAQDLDGGNKALSWIKDGQPSPDARQDAYNQRTVCYALVFRVIEAVDLAYNNQGTQHDGVISQITRRKQEAYEQINNSEDEVFQNYLYDWYLQKGWADRLLEINSPFVVDYLRRSSSNDIAHADLLCRYYAHYGDFLSAAEVQFELAKSSFPLPLNRRIEYLSRAKTNASTRVAGFSEIGARNRQGRQELLRNITDHLDIANIQDDILQKMKSDPRFMRTPDLQLRRKEVLENLDGAIQPLDDLYHMYADQAGYYDICLLIYHSADYRNLPDVRSTWSNLIDQVHTEALSSGHQSPWEMVSLKTVDLGRRTNLNENVFPVNIVLQLILQYDILHYTHDDSGVGARRNLGGEEDLLPAPLTWPIDPFIRLNAPFESLIATLESLWYSQEDPFRGRVTRKLLVKWIVYAVEQWAEQSRRSGVLFGGTENAIGLADCLRNVLGAGELERGDKGDREWVERGRVVRERVEGVAR
ncbi:Non-repetitive/WGA-negative nucleoporin C-terminal-domain-containing protein [Clohesyomyces aquaticus]|uniref:Non-repetitive/WGA-negative nucleoporin C-terminal-domain-containing protein n=1 Tax=Clohesyomyces aquaticus TaxID=1231657 RepID=A0A1Y1Y9I7_9PLEO|nr:Non-repetitive/WGA-negative nucleoporin C-terminal-domain-containing protein [Clohesyomyces aquaticus]